MPLDFDWEIKKTWKGYQNPFYKKSWEKFEPPEGEGYQCWETTSEGSPFSPVFGTFDGLCEWLSYNPSGITRKFTKEDWKKALKTDSYTEIGTGKLRLPGE